MAEPDHFRATARSHLWAGKPRGKTEKPKNKNQDNHMTTAEVYPSASIALTDEELSAINGGNPWVISIVGGMIAAYLMEKARGAAGIESGLASAANSVNNAMRGATFTNGAGVDLTLPE